MASFVALLGSVNVGGNRIVMAQLRAALEEIGLANVDTVVASGNVLFEAGDEGLNWSERIAGQVEACFGFRPFVTIRDWATLDQTIRENPFAEDGEAKMVHSIFLNEPVDAEAFSHFAASYVGPERIAAGTRCYHVDFVSDVAGSKLGAALRRAKLFKEAGTARNVRSMCRIREAMKS